MAEWTGENDGGPAFPAANPYTTPGGMSLRAWLTGMALQGILASSIKQHPNATAEDALVQADAALDWLEGSPKATRKILE